MTSHRVMTSIMPYAPKGHITNVWRSKFSIDDVTTTLNFQIFFYVSQFNLLFTNSFFALVNIFVIDESYMYRNAFLYSFYDWPG